MNPDKTPEFRKEYREVCAKAHGSFPGRWIVHHVDGNRYNNDPDNLIALPRWTHEQLHKDHRISNLPTRKQCQQMVRGYRDSDYKERLKKLREKKKRLLDDLLRIKRTEKWLKQFMR